MPTNWNSAWNQDSTSTIHCFSRLLLFNWGKCTKECRIQYLPELWSLQDAIRELSLPRCQPHAPGRRWCQRAPPRWKALPWSFPSEKELALSFDSVFPNISTGRQDFGHTTKEHLWISCCNRNRLFLPLTRWTAGLPAPGDGHCCPGKQRRASGHLLFSGCYYQQ